MLDSRWSEPRYHEKPLYNSNYNVPLLYFYEKKHQIFTSNPVILYLLNLTLARSLRVIGSLIITMSGEFELDT